MKKLDEVKIQSDKHLSGAEVFMNGDEPSDMSILDYWRWHYSEIYDLQDTIAEYIVAKALGLTEAYNVGTWTLFDILYKNVRIEVKETSYFHAWQTDEEPKSKTRNFGITKAYSEYQDNTSELKRQNDIYVFCLNTGETRATSNPLQLMNWEFYIVPTKTIDELCGDAKSITLSRLRKISKALGYKDIKPEIDRLIAEEIEVCLGEE